MLLLGSSKFWHILAPYGTIHMAPSIWPSRRHLSHVVLFGAFLVPSCVDCCELRIQGFLQPGGWGVESKRTNDSYHAYHGLSGFVQKYPQDTPESPRIYHHFPCYLCILWASGINMSLFLDRIRAENQWLQATARCHPDFDYSLATPKV